jgi:hypothetical protein
MPLCCAYSGDGGEGLWIIGIVPDPYTGFTDLPPAPDPALLVSDFQDAKKE